jgi:hypothetical protein
MPERMPVKLPLRNNQAAGRLDERGEIRERRLGRCRLCCLYPPSRFAHASYLLTSIGLGTVFITPVDFASLRLGERHRLALRRRQCGPSHDRAFKDAVNER